MLANYIEGDWRICDVRLLYLTIPISHIDKVHQGVNKAGLHNLPKVLQPKNMHNKIGYEIN